MGSKDKLTWVLLRTHCWPFMKESRLINVYPSGSWPPQRSILLRPWYESLMMTEWIFCSGRSSTSLCEKEPTLSHLSVATTATSTISPLNIRTAGLKDRLTDGTPVTLFSQVFRVSSQWVSLKDTDNKSHTFYLILCVCLCDFSFP